MRRRLPQAALALAALLLFLLTAALYWPATDWLPRLLPPQLAVEGVSGTLREGRIERLRSQDFSSGPWLWRWQALGHIDLQLGETGQRPWTLRLAGWPWNWTASGRGGDLRWWQQAPLLLGTFDGVLNWSGQWRACTSSQGQLQADSMLLLVPYPLELGATRITAECAGAPVLSAQAGLAGSHALDARFDTARWRGTLSGEVDPVGSLGRAMRGAGLLKEGQRRVELGF